MKNNHTSTWHVIMRILIDIITISFSLYLQGNVTYKYTTNVYTLQTSLLCPKVCMCLSIKWNLFHSTVATVTVLLYISKGGENGPSLLLWPVANTAACTTVQAVKTYQYLACHCADIQ